MAAEGDGVENVGGAMDINKALQEVLKNSLIHDGLARGLRECTKALDKRQAHLCILANNCDEAMYVKLVEALCQEHDIYLIKAAGLSRCLSKVQQDMQSQLKVMQLEQAKGKSARKVDDNKKLGEWGGLCKIDKEGKARKVVGCSCIVVKDYGSESAAKDMVDEYIRSKATH